MKKILSLCLVLTVLLSCVGCGTTETTNNDSANTTESTTETTTESTTESTTETTTETTTEKKTETTTIKKVENTTKKKTESTTVKKTESTTKKQETIMSSNYDELSDREKEMIWSNEYDVTKNGYHFESEEEYFEYINNVVPNYKCPYCGKHNCPGITYKTNECGHTTIYLGYLKEKCPAILAEKIKCEHCGKILVSSLDDRWLTEPDKYCDGFCYVNFG